MARDIVNDHPIENLESLALYLKQGEKPKPDWRIGTEHEKIPFFLYNKQTVPYAGEKSIETILQQMQLALAWEPIVDAGNLIGLVSPHGAAISLEPGGQFELSGAPLTNIFATRDELAAHLSTLKAIAEPLGIGFLGLGASPLCSLDQTAQMPKSRYNIMRRYMPKVGSQGLDMMYRTATIQVNLDFESESDMRTKMQLGMKLQPLATALFASSPFTEAMPNGYSSWRSNIWRDTDNHRAGLLPFVWSENFGYHDYIDWVLDVNMYFIMRDGHYIDCTHLTFREFLRQGYQNHLATMGDFVNHLSTVFPEVRLKRYIEMRGADGGLSDKICALSAFWVGLLYNAETMQAAQDFTRDWSLEDVQEMRDNVPKYGLQTKFRQYQLQDIAQHILALAHQGLTKRFEQQSIAGLTANEAVFLEPLEIIAQSGTNTAQTLLKSYNTNWQHSVLPVFQEYSF